MKTTKKKKDRKQSLQIKSKTIIGNSKSTD